MSEYSEIKDSMDFDRIVTFDKDEGPYMLVSEGRLLMELSYISSEVVTYDSGLFEFSFFPHYEDYYMSYGINSYGADEFGYVYFGTDFRIQISGDSCELELGDYVFNIDEEGNWNIVQYMLRRIQIPKTFEHTIGLEYSPSGYSIYLNGVKQDGGTYIYGEPSSKLAYSYAHENSYITYMNLNASAYKGGINNFKFSTGGVDRFHYPMDNLKTFANEIIQGKDVDLDLYSYFALRYGPDGNLIDATPNYSETILWQKDPHVDLYSRVDNPFTPLPEGILDTPPTTDQWALLCNKQTGAPYYKPLPEGGPDGSDNYPDWGFLNPSNAVRNPNLWCKSKDITCITAFSKLHAFSTNGILISPRHILLAEHIRDDWTRGQEIQHTPETTGYKRIDMTWMDMDSNYQTARGIDCITLEYDYVNRRYIKSFDLAVVLLNQEITLDVNYARFLTPSFSDHNYKLIHNVSCGHTKEGVFCIEKMAHLYFSGIQEMDITSPERAWSRFNNNHNQYRLGDSGRAMFAYDGDRLYFTGVITNQVQGFPYDSNGDGVSFNAMGGQGATYVSNLIQKAMNDLDDRNGYLNHYELCRGPL